MSNIIKFPKDHDKDRVYTEQEIINMPIKDIVPSPYLDIASLLARADAERLEKDHD